MARSKEKGRLKKKSCCQRCAITCLVIFLVFNLTLFVGGSILFKATISDRLGGLTLSDMFALAGNALSGNRADPTYDDQDLDDFYQELSRSLYIENKSEAELEYELVAEDKRQTLAERAAAASSEEEPLSAFDLFESLSAAERYKLATTDLTEEQFSHLATDRAARKAAGLSLSRISVSSILNDTILSDGGESSPTDSLSDLSFTFSALAEYEIIYDTDDAETVAAKEAKNEQIKTVTLTGNEVSAFVNEIVETFLSSENSPLTSFLSEGIASEVKLPDYVKIASVSIENRPLYEDDEGGIYNEKDTELGLTISIKLRELIVDVLETKTIEEKFSDMPSLLWAGLKKLIPCLVPKYFSAETTIYPLAPEEDHRSMLILLNNPSEENVKRLSILLNALLSDGEEDGPTFLEAMNNSVVSAFQTIDQYTSIAFVPTKDPDGNEVSALRIKTWESVTKLLAGASENTPFSADDMLIVLKGVFVQGEQPAPMETTLAVSFFSEGMSMKYGTPENYFEENNILSSDTLSQMPNHINLSKLDYSFPYTEETFAEDFAEKDAAMEVNLPSGAIADFLEKKLTEDSAATPVEGEDSAAAEGEGEEGDSGESTESASDNDAFREMDLQICALSIEHDAAYDLPDGTPVFAMKLLASVKLSEYVKSKAGDVAMLNSFLPDGERAYIGLTVFISEKEISEAVSSDPTVEKTRLDHAVAAAIDQAEDKALSAYRSRITLNSYDERDSEIFFASLKRILSTYSDNPFDISSLTDKVEDMISDLFTSLSENKDMKNLQLRLYAAEEKDAVAPDVFSDDKGGLTLPSVFELVSGMTEARLNPEPEKTEEGSEEETVEEEHTYTVFSSADAWMALSLIYATEKTTYTHDYTEADADRFVDEINTKYYFKDEEDTKLHVKDLFGKKDENAGRYKKATDPFDPSTDYYAIVPVLERAESDFEAYLVRVGEDDVFKKPTDPFDPSAEYYLAIAVSLAPEEDPSDYYVKHAEGDLSQKITATSFDFSLLYCDSTEFEDLPVQLDGKSVAALVSHKDSGILEKVAGSFGDVSVVAAHFSETDRTYLFFDMEVSKKEEQEDATIKYANLFPEQFKLSAKVVMNNPDDPYHSELYINTEEDDAAEKGEKVFLMMQAFGGDSFNRESIAEKIGTSIGDAFTNLEKAHVTMHYTVKNGGETDSDKYVTFDDFFTMMVNSTSMTDVDFAEEEEVELTNAESLMTRMREYGRQEKEHLIQRENDPDIEIYNENWLDSIDPFSEADYLYVDTNVQLAYFMKDKPTMDTFYPVVYEKANGALDLTATYYLFSQVDEKQESDFSSYFICVGNTYKKPSAAYDPEETYYTVSKVTEIDPNALLNYCVKSKSASFADQFDTIGADGFYLSDDGDSLFYYDPDATDEDFVIKLKLTDKALGWVVHERESDTIEEAVSGSGNMTAELISLAFGKDEDGSDYIIRSGIKVSFTTKDPMMPEYFYVIADTVYGGAFTTSISINGLSDEETGYFFHNFGSLGNKGMNFSFNKKQIEEKIANAFKTAFEKMKDVSFDAFNEDDFLDSARTYKSAAYTELGLDKDSMLGEICLSFPSIYHYIVEKFYEENEIDEYESDEAHDSSLESAMQHMIVALHRYDPGYSDIYEEIITNEKTTDTPTTGYLLTDDPHSNILLYSDRELGAFVSGKVEGKEVNDKLTLSGIEQLIILAGNANENEWNKWTAYFSIEADDGATYMVATEKFDDLHDLYTSGTSIDLLPEILYFSVMTNVDSEEDTGLIYAMSDTDMEIFMKIVNKNIPEGEEPFDIQAIAGEFGAKVREALDDLKENPPAGFTIPAGYSSDLEYDDKSTEISYYENIGDEDTIVYQADGIGYLKLSLKEE